MDKNEKTKPDGLDDLLVDSLEVQFPIEGHSGATLRNLVNMLASKQKLIAKAFNINGVLLDENFAQALNEKVICTTEDFTKAILDLGPDRSPGLSFDFENGTFTFKLAGGSFNSDKVTAFRDLAALMDNNAKILKHVSFKPAQEDNPKFAFRTWLTRLGMNGGEYKASRKAMLASLEGSSAFRKPQETNKKTLGSMELVEVE
ncbi:virulence-related protein [Pelotomaculum propionicicum]|uniref:virulence-related protein n=1 Tax=Pelotomaculum propionicicum TaxID=258475 RepID=UPI003B7C46BA